MPQLDLSTVTVLLADPSQHMTTLIASMLRSIGVTKILAVNSKSGFAKALATTSFDLLLVLDRAPRWDGLPLVQMLRSKENQLTRDAHAIMMSREAMAERVTMARDAGINAFIRKPFAAKDLQVRIETAFNQPVAFVDGESYAGPDRRRRADFPGEDRRASPKPSSKPRS